MASVTLSQMLQHPMIRGIVSRIKPAGVAFQNFYNMTAVDMPTEPMGNLNRHLRYEIFDHTRTRTSFRAPDVAPARRSAKPVGFADATALRIYESIPFRYSSIQATRPLGGQYGQQLDEMGQTWVRNQVSRQMESMANSIEFMVSRMFRGGFGLSRSGDDWWATELGAGDFDISYPIPAGNKTNIGGIIDAEWDLAATKIVNHMLELNKYAELLTGYPIRHVWINSSTFKYMLANTQLTTVRGTSMRVFEQMERQLYGTAADGTPQREIGFTVQFPAMPQFIFHVYDAVSVATTYADQEQDPDTPTTTNSSLYVPDGIAIMTPEPDPGGWHGMYHCGEIVRPGGDHVPAEVRTGFSSWTNPMNHPPGEELTIIHNLTPLLYIPRSVFYATVWT